MTKRRKLVPAPVSRIKSEEKEEKVVMGSGDVSNARNRLKGALQELLDQSDDSSMSSHDESSQSDVFGQSMSSRKTLSVKSEPVIMPQQQMGRMRTQRKRRRRETVNDAAFHHTYVMKLFDRSVDLAQFKEDTPLYPICRAWMANQPRNTNLVPKLRTPTPPPPPDDPPAGVEGGDSDGEIVRDTYKMPPPVPIPTGGKRTLRVPSPIPQPKDDNNSDKTTDTAVLQEAKPTRETLLHNHVVHWTAVRKKWHSASHMNEARFNESGQILKAIYKRAQKAYE